MYTWTIIALLSEHEVLSVEVKRRQGVKLKCGNMHKRQNENRYSKEPYGEDFVLGQPML